MPVVKLRCYLEVVSYPEKDGRPARDVLRCRAGTDDVLLQPYGDVSEFKALKNPQDVMVFLPIETVEERTPRGAFRRKVSRWDNGIAFANADAAADFLAKQQGIPA